eukprot:763525-Hanusia_phi.AAC.3
MDGQEGAVITMPHPVVRSLGTGHEDFKVSVLLQVREAFLDSSPFVAGFGNQVGAEGKVKEKLGGARRQACAERRIADFGRAGISSRRSAEIEHLHSRQVLQGEQEVNSDTHTSSWSHAHVELLVIVL